MQDYFGIVESRYTISDKGHPNKGNLEDVMHPQARYTMIARLDTDKIMVQGRRPRIFNIGVKKFDVLIVPSKRFREDLRNAEPNKKLFDELYDYLLKC